MHPAATSTSTRVPTRSDKTGPAGAWEHELAVAQLEAMAFAVDRLSRAVERLSASVVELEARPAADVPVSPGQLRLVVGG